MSAVNMLKFDADIVVYSDTAMYDDQARMMGHLQKAHILFPQKAIVATRGPIRMMGLYRMHAAHRRDFDDIVHGMASDLRDAVRVGYELGEPSCMTVDVAGWSESAGEFQLYEMWAIGPSPDELDQQSLELHPYGPIFSVPHINPAKLAGSGLLDENGALHVDDLDTTMIRLMQLQRSTNYKVSPASDHRGCIVGGSIQKTHMNLAGAETTIIHRWSDDVIGKPVGWDINDRDEFYYPGEISAAA